MPFSIGSWNVGGASLELLPASLMGSDPGHRSPLGLVGLQEVSRDSPGWNQTRVGKWTVLTHQNDTCWRGSGLAFDAQSWSVMRRLFTDRGTWFRVRNAQHGVECWIGSVYLPPHLATGEMQTGLQEFLKKVPATTLPVYVTGDTNAAIKWSSLNSSPYSGDSKGRALLDALLQHGFTLIPPKPSQLHQATSRPRKDPGSGRAIDWIACKRGLWQQMSIMTDSCFDLGTDHDTLILNTLARQTGERQKRITSGKRVVTSPPVLQDRIDQQVLRGLAERHTSKPKRQGYRDDEVPRPFSGLLDKAASLMTGNER